MGTINVSADLGRGYVKAVSSSGESTSFRSVVAESSRSLSGFDFGLSTADDGFVISFQGREYVLGEAAFSDGILPRSTVDYSRLDASELPILLAGALARVVPEDAAVRLVVSLPPGDYDQKNKVKNRLAGRYDVRASHDGRLSTRAYEIPIENIRVIPEGLGPVILQSVDRMGRFNSRSRLIDMAVGVIDVGTYTTDLVFFDQLQLNKRLTTSIENVGMSNMFDYLKGALRREFGVTLDYLEVDRVIRRGYVVRDGKRQPIAPWLDEIRSLVAERIVADVRRVWRGAGNVDAILIAGGGGPFVADVITMNFPHASLIDEVEPHFANAEGGLRYGILRDRKD